MTDQREGAENGFWRALGALYEHVRQGTISVRSTPTLLFLLGYFTFLSTLKRVWEAF